MPDLRKRAVREVERNYAHVFADAVHHKRILNFLYTIYLTSSASEAHIAAEFWRAYRHFVEGRSILEFDFRLLSRAEIIPELRKILRGDPTNLDMEKQHNDHRE